MFVDTLKAKILAATKARNEVERDVLKLVLGEAQTIEGSKNRKGGKPLLDEEYYAIMQSMVDNNAITLGYSNNLEFTEVLEEEIKILRKLIPVRLTQDQIESYLFQSSKIDAIKSFKNDGQAIGLVMKDLKEANLYVSGDDVKAVVVRIRQN